MKSLITYILSLSLLIIFQLYNSLYSFFILSQSTSLILVRIRFSGWNPQYNQFCDQKIKDIFINLKEKGFQSCQDATLTHEIFQIELKYPFIFKQDLQLLNLYLGQNFQQIINNNQLIIILKQGFDQIIQLRNHFSFKEIEFIQKSIQTSIELRKYLDLSLKMLKFIPRLHQVAQLISDSEKNQKIPQKNEIEVNFIFSFDTFKKAISEETISKLQQRDIDVFFSKDILQNLYIRFIILSELSELNNENQPQPTECKFYFKEVFHIIHLLFDDPEVFVDAWKNKNSEVGGFEELLFKKVDLFDYSNENGLKQDIIKILISSQKTKNYLLRLVFENQLECYNLDSSKLNDLFYQFSNYGLNYFHQIEDVERINEIQKSLNGNKLLKQIFGNNFYNEQLLSQETYSNFQQLVEQAKKIDTFFKLSQKKIKMNDFMKYIKQDQSQMTQQIEKAVERLCSERQSSFIEIIFNIIIQQSKRYQHLSSLFDELSLQLKKKNKNNYLFNQKLFTEYLFMSLDNEVSSKLTYLLGYLNPLPLILSRLNSQNNSIEQIVMKNIYWLLSDDDSVVASIGFGYQRGKSQFLNDVFLTNFEISDKSFAFQGSADIQSNKYFKTEKRDYCIVDYHGDCLELNSKYFLKFYKFFLIQINFSFLKSKKFKDFTKICQELDSSFQKICFIVRDYIESQTNFNEYFDFNKTREKLRCQFFMDKNVILMPNLKKLERDDKNFIISQSRHYLNQMIVESNKILDKNSRYTFAKSALEKEDEEYNINVKVKQFLKQIILSYNSDPSTLLTIYPLFKKYSTLKLLLMRKHFSESQEQESKQQETDLDREFCETETRYNNYIMNSDGQISKLSQKFIEILTSKLNLHNTMTYFTNQLKQLNQQKIHSHIDQDIQISVEILWREIIQIYLKYPNFSKNDDILCAYRTLISKGFPFEIIDGENFFFPKQFLTNVFNCEEFKEKKMCIISILGPQNSGKSTLLNFLLGCDFSVSDERCTKGIYGTLIKSNTPEFDFILVIDSEGLQSLEKNDSEYDRKLTLFCLSISNLVIINVKDQLTLGMTELLQVCISARQNIEANTIQKPIIEIVFNQIADPNENNYQQAIDNVFKSLNENKLHTEIDISKENLTFLPSAITTEVVSIGGQRLKQWRYLKTQVDFVEKVKAFGLKIFDKLLKNQRQNSLVKSKNIVENIKQWIDLASVLYDTISFNPSLTAFKDIKSKEVDRKLKDYIQDQMNVHFNSQFSEDIAQQTLNLKMQDSEDYIFRICEEKLNSILMQYEEHYLNMGIKSDDHFERNKNYIKIQIDSFRINQINNIKIQKNMIKIKLIIDDSIHIFDQKIKNLKANQVSIKDVEMEFESIFNEVLKMIKSKIPNPEQINQDTFQFVNDQYKRYCQYDLNFTQQKNISTDFNTIKESILRQIKENVIFFETKQSIKNQQNYQFTNELFQNNLNQFQNTFINVEQLINYFVISGKLINTAFQQSLNLNSFVSKNNASIEIKQNNFLNNNLNNKQIDHIDQNNNKIQIELQHMLSPTKNNYGGEGSHQNKLDQQVIIGKIQQYNQALNILNIKLDPSFIFSQIESNKHNLKDQVELIIEGKEEFIQIQELTTNPPIEQLQKKFLKKLEDSGWKKLQQFNGKNLKNNTDKIEIQFWKPFISWIRIYLQNKTQNQDIVDIQKLVDTIMNSITLKSQNKRVNEELIQSICATVNQEIQQQEVKIEIFNLKFSLIFKQCLHNLALLILYKQEQQTRNKDINKPIKDFEGNKSEIKKQFIEKFEAINNDNQLASLTFYEFVKEKSKAYIESKFKQKINQQNENNISRYKLQQEIEANLSNFSIEEANQYIQKPLEQIQEILNLKLKNQLEDLEKEQNNQQQILKDFIDDTVIQLVLLNQQIDRQLFDDQDNEMTNQNSYLILKRIKQNDNEIEEINTDQKDIINNKMKAFSIFIFNTIIGCKDKIFVNNKEYKIELNIVPLYKIQENQFFKIKEFKQIQNFRAYKQIILLSLFKAQRKISILQKIISLKLILFNAINQRNNQNNCMVVSLVVKLDALVVIKVVIKTIGNLKGLQMVQQKININLDQDIDSLHFVVQKQKTQMNLHQFFALIMRILIISWKVFKENNPEWDWDFIGKGDPTIQRNRSSCLWKMVGKQICQKYGISNYVESMSDKRIKQLKKQPKSIHFIFAFDQSGSMHDKFYGLKKSLVGFINQRNIYNQSKSSKDVCTLLGFNKGIQRYFEYKEISPQIVNDIPLQISGGGTSFSNAIKGISSVLSQNRDYDKNIFVIFLSDGDDKLPSQEITQLNTEYKGRIKEFWTIGYGNQRFYILRKMAELLKDCGGQFKQFLDSNELIQELKKIAFIIPNQN